jgi:2-polyprenyl-3-methyl-5-hydroxy-6-metoxy-1,4-benzoquinol methylase
MNYDPIKDRLGAIFNRRPIFQRIFYWLLGIFFLRTWYVKREINRLMNDLGSAPRMLDAGTGFGQYTWWFVKKWPSSRILAVDVKDDYLQALKSFLKSQGVDNQVNLEIADLTQRTFQPPYDLILSVDVMEHIEDDRAVFRNFYSSLREGGFVLVNTPSDQGGSDVGHDSDESFIGEHVRDGYNVAELEEKLRSAGLTPVRTIYTYGPLGSLAWKFLIKWPMLMLNKSFGFILLLPFYYLIFLIPGLFLNWMDLLAPNSTGTGLIVIAVK